MPSAISARSPSVLESAQTLGAPTPLATLPTLSHRDLAISSTSSRTRTTAVPSATFALRPTRTEVEVTAFSENALRLATVSLTSTFSLGSAEMSLLTPTTG